MATYNVDEIKAALKGRWAEFHCSLAGINSDDLDGRHHGCPKCGGKDRFRVLDDYAEAGAMFCNRCFREKNGDGLSATQWLVECSFPTALQKAAEFAGISPKSNGHPKTDLLNLICVSKRMPVASAKAYGAAVAQRGERDVVRFPVVNAEGDLHSHFDLTADGGKGLFKKGKGCSGLFLPMTDDGKPRLPAAGEVWILCEGVKDAAAYHSLGYLACGMPTDHLAAKYARFFRGCKAVVMPDRTTLAEQKALTSAARLYGVAESVRVGTLPLAIDGDDGDDARDVLRQRNGEQLLRQTVDDAVEWHPSSTAEATPANALWLSIASHEGQTDAANVRRLLQLFGDDVLYVPPWKRWLIWDGSRFKPDDSCEVERRALEFAESLWMQFAREAPDVDRDTLGRMQTFCRRSNDRERIAGTLKMLAPYVAVSPSQLDSQSHLFNCANGTIDLATGQLRAHSKADRLTKMSPAAHDLDADCPTWIRFVRDICGGDDELVRYIQNLAGYSLLGSVEEHVLAFLYGKGANGKSTFVETLLDVFGDYGMKANAEMLLARKNESHPTERADLVGRRFVAAVEADAGRSFAESVLKELTGGDSIRARRVYENFWEFTPSHTIWLAANHKPIVKGTDDGFWRRLKLVPFVRQWDADGSRPDLPPADKNLREKLSRELNGILMWLLNGLATWRADGLQTPSAVDQASTEYRTDSDIIGQFLEDCCIVGDGYRCPASQLFERYQKWCEENGIGSWSNTMFGNNLSDRNITACKSHGRKFRRGLMLRGTVGDS